MNKHIEFVAVPVSHVHIHAVAVKHVGFVATVAAATKRFVAAAVKRVHFHAETGD
jgi:hypothetical protein